MAENNIELLTEAYNKGKQAGQQWVETCKANNTPIQPPVLPPATDIVTQWFQKGIKEVVDKASNFKAVPQFIGNGRVKPNCIDRMLKEKGANFIAKLGERNGREVSNFASRVIRDMFYANVLDIQKYRNIFENQKFFTAMMNECNSQLYYHSNCAAALAMYLPTTTDPEGNIAGFYNYHKANESMYQLLFNRLIDFKTFLDKGIFNPDPLIQVQREIYKEGWSKIGRDPYSRTRVW